jgi:hypothetical protein
VIVAVVLGVAVAFVRSDQAVNAAHDAARSTAAGYPAHYGLAGPSRLGSSGSSWIGYPPHFGLAGPSAVGKPASPSGIGQGYPPHYGLAGSSQVSGD